MNPILAANNPFQTLPMPTPRSVWDDIEDLLLPPPIPTAVRVFGPGDILAKMEPALDSIVADINAAIRLGEYDDIDVMPVFLRDPSPEYCSIVRRPR